MRVAIVMGMLMGVFLLTSVQGLQQPYVINLDEMVVYTAQATVACCPDADALDRVTASADTDWETIILQWVQIIALLVLLLPVIYTMTKGKPETSVPHSRPYPAQRIKD